MPDRSNQPLRTAGSAWGPQRVALGISIRALAKMTGIHASHLSLMEQGRLLPTGEEFAKVTAALDSIRYPEVAS